jgi:exopolysaccharide production protein ExoY
LASIPLVHDSAPPDDVVWQAVGCCERVFAAFLLLAALPILLLAAFVVWVLSGRTPWIAHRRVGWRGAELWMLKLRTMWGGEARARAVWVERIDDWFGPTQKRPSDPRVPNAFARFCRRYSIDELPQLWHVVRGEMSLIGPRPLTRRELREYYGEFATEVLRVKPGLAGLWQISGRNRLSYAERLAMDLEFVRRRSIGLYLRIATRAVPEVLSGANTW